MKKDILKTEKKYQHYVPKFYLRFFSNNKKSVGTYIFDKNKYIQVAPLDSIGGSNYLYGEDGTIEDWFSELEGKWNLILKKIIDNNNIDINYEEYLYLLMFIFLSEARSKTSADLMNNFINDLAIVTNNMDPKTKKKYSYSDNIARFNIPNLHQIEVMPEIIPILFDLNLILINNQTSNQFITSDCIVNKYNQFLLEKNYERGYGYGSCGIMFLIPISPKHCLFLYDSAVYNIKVEKNIVTIKNPQEINKLNRMFMYNADKNIFFNESFEKNKIEILLKNTVHILSDENTIFKSKDGEFLVKIGSRYIDKNFDLKFVKVKDRLKKIKISHNISAPIRPYAQMLNDEKKKKEMPKEVRKRLEGKKFYLEKK